MGLATLYLYCCYGRPTPVKPDAENPCCHQAGETKKRDSETPPAEQCSQGCHEPSQAPIADPGKAQCCAHKLSITSSLPGEPSHSPFLTPSRDVEKQNKTPASIEGMSHCHTSSSTRPMWATVLIGVSHCGAGCVLGDLIGEWLVYGTSASIRYTSIWPELLIDYAFALLFGIVFQYFSIAPMSGHYGPKSVWWAAKTDVLSLTSFEIGAFGWMVAYQVGNLGVSAGDDDVDVLVDDASGDGDGVHDRRASELVAYLKGDQGALLLIDSERQSTLQSSIESTSGRGGMLGTKC